MSVAHDPCDIDLPTRIVPCALGLTSKALVYIGRAANADKMRRLVWDGPMSRQ